MVGDERKYLDRDMAANKTILSVNQMKGGIDQWVKESFQQFRDVSEIHTGEGSGWIIDSIQFIELRYILEPKQKCSQK